MISKKIFSFMSILITFTIITTNAGSAIKMTNRATTTVKRNGEKNYHRNVSSTRKASASNTGNNGGSSNSPNNYGSSSNSAYNYGFQF